MIKEPRIAADILVMPHGAKLLSDRFKGGDEVVPQPHLVQKGGGSETLCQSLSVHASRMPVQTDIASIGTSIAFRRLVGHVQIQRICGLSPDNRGEHLLRSQRQRQIPT